MTTTATVNSSPITATVAGASVSATVTSSSSSVSAAGGVGPQGPAGAAGAAGQQGIPGVAGAAGVQGPAGPAGAAGVAGAKGDTGERGPAGPAGEAGPQGIQGVAGVAGAKGDTGSQGPAGPAGPQGIQGNPGVAGATGPAGAAGAKGDTGSVGPQGEPGVAGAVGPAGPAGVAGATGAQGPQGVAGATGSVGPQGPAGATGATGPAASLVYASIGDFPATGSSTALYLAEDTSRIYQWESPVYVEVGVSGGGVPTTSAADLTSGTLADARLSANVVLTGDSRLADARTPTSHAHGNLTDAGAIGSTTGQVVVTTTSGVLTTAATISAASQVSGLAAVATSGSAADLSAGTLPDARLSSAVATVSQLNTTLGQASGVIDAVSRVSSSSGVTAAAGQALLAFFTPTASVTVSQITMSTNTGAVASGLTLARMGIYTYTEGGTATLVARTASDTTLFAATSTAYTRSLDTTGGYPGTYTLNAGTRYGVAYICVGTTQPQLNGRTVVGSVGGLSPRLSTGTATGLSDLPTSFTPGTNSQAPFARLS